VRCWRCGSKVDQYDGRLLHKAWCSDGTPNDCDHCGGNPCRWWCLGAGREPLNIDMPPARLSGPYHRERNRRIATGEWMFA
jgi:hypothetical protein